MMEKSQRSLDTMAKFAHEEIFGGGYPSVANYLKSNPRAMAESLAKTIGKSYIGWAYEQTDVAGPTPGSRVPFDWRGADTKRRRYLLALEKTLGTVGDTKSEALAGAKETNASGLLAEGEAAEKAASPDAKVASTGAAAPKETAKAALEKPKTDKASVAAATTVASTGAAAPKADAKTTPGAASPKDTAKTALDKKSPAEKTTPATGTPTGGAAKSDEASDEPVKVSVPDTKTMATNAVATTSKTTADEGTTASTVRPTVANTSQTASADMAAATTAPRIAARTSDEDTAAVRDTVTQPEQANVMPVSSTSTPTVRAVDDADNIPVDIVAEKQKAQQEAAIVAAEKRRQDALDSTSTGMDAAVALMKEQLRVMTSMDSNLTKIEKHMANMAKGMGSGSSPQSAPSPAAKPNLQLVGNNKPTDPGKPPVSVSRAS
jgi:hypothetical protein